jgi:hypothetical protein
MTDRLATIARMLSAGHTMTEIAAALCDATGQPASRSLVAGIIYRARKAGDPRYPEDRHEGNPGRASLANMALAAERRRAAAEERARHMTDRPGSATALVIGWRRRQCRWIDGDVYAGDVTGCPHDAVPGEPYCRHHLLRAWQPEKSRPRGDIVRLARAF